MISAGLATINAILKPFKFCFPQIYSLPSDCLLMLESPVPVQIGLRMSCQEFFEKGAKTHLPKIKDNDQIIFLFLDENFTMASKQLLNSLIAPYFDDFLIVLQVLYKKAFNPKTSNFFKISKKKSKNLRKYSISRSSNYSYNDKISKMKKKSSQVSTNDNPNITNQMLFKDQHLTELFDYLQSTFRKFIISRLPAIKMKNKNDFKQEFISEIKIEQFSSNPFDQAFLKKFFETQMFHYFYENDYLQRDN
jgi:hypothetical protein